jgi:hypothetical protein
MGGLWLMMKIQIDIYFILVMFLLPAAAKSHQGANHGKSKSLPSSGEKEQAMFTRVNEIYVSHVKPIFQKKCFDCHSNQTRYPWYFSLPGVKQLIAKDVREAKEHLDFSRDYPFEGHGTPREDLEAIERSIHDGTMPPLRYRILHPGSGITPEERLNIQRWIEESRQIFKQ